MPGQIERRFALKNTVAVVGRRGRGREVIVKPVVFVEGLEEDGAGPDLRICGQRL